MHKYRHALMMSIIFHTMKTIGKSTSALQFTTNHNDGAIRDVLVGCLSPLPHSGRHSSELPLALRPSNKHYWKCARIAPESMMISSCFTFRLTLFCVSPLSLRPGVAGVCFEVPSCESLCLDGLCHVISGILAGGIPGFRMVLCCFTHSLVWPGGLGVFCLFCCFAIPY